MSIKKKILVTGSNGQVGKELKRLATSYPHLDFIFTSRAELKIHHFELVRNFFRGYRPDYVINCAAYTAVDRAESERDLAFIINGESVGVLAAICKEHNAKLLHISTDYVFDGRSGVPYREDAPAHPRTVYGSSKLEGEQQAIQFNPDTIIIRTSWVHSSFGKNFVKTMLSLMEEKEAVRVVNDQVGSPTYAADLAEMMLQIIVSNKWIPGIYHYSNSGAISWYEFACYIRDVINSECVVKPIPSSEFPTPAERPRYSVLDLKKIRDVYQITIKDWKESVRRCISEIKNL